MVAVYARVCGALNPRIAKAADLRNLRVRCQSAGRCQFRSRFQFHDRLRIRFRGCTRFRGCFHGRVDWEVDTRAKDFRIEAAGRVEVLDTKACDHGEAAT